jgi:hypothetical protein
LIQNEENKKLQAIQKQKERLDDIKSAEDYTKVLDKQENDRKMYFKNIELKANNFLAKMSATVLKDIENKNKEDEEKVKKYEREKEEKILEKERKQLEKIRLQKREMRHFLDSQVEEKKRQKEFENYIEKAQAHVWNTDVEVNKEQNRIVAEKVIIFYFLDKKNE